MTRPNPLPTSSRPVSALQDVIQGRPADLRRRSDIHLAGAGVICLFGKAPDLGHGGFGFGLSPCATFSLLGQFGEQTVGVHAPSVKHLTSGVDGRKVVYMTEQPPTRWTIVAMTAAGRMAYGTFDTREAAEARKAQIEDAQSHNPFPTAPLTIEPEGEWDV